VASLFFGRGLRFLIASSVGLIPNFSCTLNDIVLCLARLQPRRVVQVRERERERMSSGWKPAVQPDRCPKCGRSVYANEAKLAAGKKWHAYALLQVWSVSHVSLLSAVATTVWFSAVFFSVNTITHKPLHLAWINFAWTCSLPTSTTSRTLLNFGVFPNRRIPFRRIWIRRSSNTNLTGRTRTNEFVTWFAENGVRPFHIGCCRTYDSRWTAYSSVISLQSTT